jgi:integrase
MILIQCYSGWRPSELIELKLQNIRLDKNEFTGGSKTEAGKNRTVPIHPKIVMLVRKKYNDAKAAKRDTLFSITDYKTYHTEFQSTMKALNITANHRPHDCRKHFVTLAKRSGVDEYAIKRIVGHRISDLTETVYTQRDPDWLHHEIEKIV